METTYIALLRGINVGGHRVKMDALRDLFRELGYAGVSTYIQTGNVFFRSEETDPQGLRHAIELHLKQSLGYEVPACVRSVEQLEQIMALDPFAGVEATDDTRLAIDFLAEPVDVALSLPHRTPDGAYEVIGQTPSELFVVWHLQDGRPGRSYNHLMRQIGVPATTRFWHTAAKILAAARAAGE